MIRNPDLVDALRLHRACDGKPGIEGLQIISNQAVSALALIDDARAAKLEEDLKRGSK